MMSADNTDQDHYQATRSADGRTRPRSANLALLVLAIVAIIATIALVMVPRRPVTPEPDPTLVK